MSTPPAPSRGKRPLGCAVILALVVGAVVGAGLLFERAHEAEKTPCERYADLMVSELDNCHSGANRSRPYLIELCEASVDPSPACLAQVEALGCDAIERGPHIVAPEVCGRKATP